MILIAICIFENSVKKQSLKEFNEERKERRIEIDINEELLC